MYESDSSLQYLERKKNIFAIFFSQFLIMDQLVAMGNHIMNNKNKGTRTPVNFHTIKVPRDDTLIDDERFFQCGRHLCKRQKNP